MVRLGQTTLGLAGLAEIKTTAPFAANITPDNLSIHPFIEPWILPLLFCFNPKDIDQAARQLVDDHPPIIMQGPPANLGIGLHTDIKGIMPRQIECHCLNCGGTGQIMRLLQDQGVQHYRQILGWSARVSGKILGKYLDREILEKMLTGNSGPTTIKKCEVLGTKATPRVKQLSWVSAA